MRLDHLLSKEEEVRVELLLICQSKTFGNSAGGGFSNGFAKQILFSGGDALRGDTRSHPEHDG